MAEVGFQDKVEQGESKAMMATTTLSEMQYIAAADGTPVAAAEEQVHA